VRGTTHPVFNISRLKQYQSGIVSQPHRIAPITRPLLEIRHEDGAEIFEVDRILDAYARGVGARRRYLGLWVGYPPWEATWEPLSNIAGAADALADYEASH
jgi:hypothetical protein